MKSIHFTIIAGIIATGVVGIGAYDVYADGKIDNTDFYSGILLGVFGGVAGAYQQQTKGDSQNGSEGRE